jgi:hypothetical protein
MDVRDATTIENMSIALTNGTKHLKRT